MPLRQNLISVWALDSGPNFTDSVGGHTLSAQNDSIGGNGDGFLTHSAGLIGDAADNSNVDTGSGLGSIINGGNAAFETSGSFSVDFWFKLLSGSVNDLARQGFDSSIGTNWSITGSPPVFTASSSVSAVTDVSDGNWHHIAGVFNGTQVKIYVDGTLEDTQSSSASFGFGNFLYFLGWEDGAGALLSTNNTIGLIDEIGYWHKALTDAEVASRYNSGAGLAGKYFGYSLNFATQPSNAAAGVNMSPSPAVEILDEAGNRDTATTDSITLAIGTNPSGGTLTTGTNPKSATSGLATFNTTSINNAGTGYTLTAAATGLAGATSSTFDVTGSAVTVTPGTATLTLTTYAPAVLTPRLCTPPTASLTLSGFAPTVSAPRLVTPPTASLTLTSYAPAVITPVLCTPPTATLTISTFSPVVATPVLCTPGVVAVSLSMFAPTVSTPVVATPSTVALIVSTFAPVVSTPRICTPDTAAITITSYAPSLPIPVIATPDTASLTLTTYAPEVIAITMIGKWVLDFNFNLNTEFALSLNTSFELSTTTSLDPLAIDTRLPTLEYTTNV